MVVFNSDPPLDIIMSINTASPGEIADMSTSTVGKRDTLPIRVQLIYGIGHVLNDMCASMWFTYLLVYFHLVLGFGAAQAGLVLLIGQVADALATPFVGFHSDTSDPSAMCSYGRRKSWHLFGIVLTDPIQYSI